jgi:hypothetical protein
MTEPIKGLRASLLMADVSDPIEALKNLNLNILDLDRIRGIADAAVSPEDIRTLSGLNDDVEKTVVGIYSEAVNYPTYLSPLTDSRTLIGTNLTANAAIVGSSFKFDALSANGTVVTSDLSTSRASAWSSLGDGLYYGAKVTVANQVELSSLTVDRPIKQRRFESEIPTHKVRFNIDGSTYDAYAMKNIPIKFTGFFSSARGIYITVSNARPGSASPYLRPSWVVTDTDTSTSVTFENILAGSLTTGLTQNRNSTISILGSRAKERDIEFFYPVNNIKQLYLPNIKIYSFPDAVFPALTSAVLTGADFREMPDFKKYTPNLTSLNLSQTDLTRSDDSSLRLFNDNIANRLPTTLTTLTLDNSYSGPATANLAILTSLSYLSIGTYWNSGKRLSGTSPAINPATIDYYDVTYNQFSELHHSIRESDTLRILKASHNALGASANVSISPTNTVIEQLYLNGNSCNFINVAGKSSLKIYNRSSSTASGNVTPLFTDCDALEEISVDDTRLSGRLPSFDTNTSLKRFQAWNTRILAADPTYSINNSTFGSSIDGGCRPTLQSFLISSPTLAGSIEGNSMDGMTALRTFWLTSTRTGVSGEVPLFRQSGNLTDLSLRSNNLSGSLPSFSSNPTIQRINISLNSLSGRVPSLNLSSLTTLILNNNSLTGINNLTCPLLKEINVATNSITAIPSFGGCPSIQTIDMSSNPMSSNPAAYVADTFTPLTALRSLNLANCGLSRSIVDQILVDLGKNYDANPRTRVSVNLVGNASPSATTEIQTFIISRLRSSGWTIGVS